VAAAPGPRRHARPGLRRLAGSGRAGRRAGAGARPRPVLDIGCGPGRHVHALARRGVLALGVDVSAGALALARARGAAVFEASIFAEVPHPGQWASALLLDGNADQAGLSVRERWEDGGRWFAELR
jgi:SAM-dependent methyltransferase